MFAAWRLRLARGRRRALPPTRRSSRCRDNAPRHRGGVVSAPAPGAFMREELAHRRALARARARRGVTHPRSPRSRLRRAHRPATMRSSAADLRDGRLRREGSVAWFRTAPSARRSADRPAVEPCAPSARAPSLLRRRLRALRRTRAPPRAAPPASASRSPAARRRFARSDSGPFGRSSARLRRRASATRFGTASREAERGPAPPAEVAATAPATSSVTYRHASVGTTESVKSHCLRRRSFLQVSGSAPSAGAATAASSQRTRVSLRGSLCAATRSTISPFVIARSQSRPARTAPPTISPIRRPRRRATPT